MDRHKTSKPSDNEDKLASLESDETSVSIEAPKTSTKKKLLLKNKWLILAVTAIILIGGAASWYFFIHKKSSDTANKSANSSQTAQNQSKPNTVVFISGSDPTTYQTIIKKLDLSTAVVSDFKTLPAGIGIIASDATAGVPHIYWTVGGYDKPLDIYYLEGTNEPKLIKSLDKKYSIFSGAIMPDKSGVTVNLYASNDTKGGKIVTISNDGSVKDLFTSTSVGGKTTWPDGSHLPLVPSFWSDDTKLLFLASVNCFNCDGGSNGNMLKYDVAANKLTTVLSSTIGSGSSSQLNSRKILGVYNIFGGIGGPMNYEETIAAKEQIIVYDFISDKKQIIYEDPGSSVVYATNIIGNSEDGSSLYQFINKPVKGTAPDESGVGTKIDANELYEIRQYNSDTGTYKVISLPNTDKYSSVQIVTDKAGYMLYNVGRTFQPGDTNISAVNSYIYASGVAKKVDLGNASYWNQL